MSKKSISKSRINHSLQTMAQHADAVDLALRAANENEVSALEEALALIERAETAALVVSQTTMSDVGREETRAAAIGLVSAAGRMRTALAALRA